MFSVFENPEYTAAKNKIVDVLNDVLAPNELQIVLQEAPLMEATQLYCEGFKYWNHINYERWAQRLKERFVSASVSECEQSCHMLMEVFSTLDKFKYDFTDLEFFHATWSIPEFSEYAHKHLNAEQSQRVVECVVTNFGNYFSKTAVNKNLDFVPQWEQLVSMANRLDVNILDVIKNRFDFFSDKAVVRIYEYYNWNEEIFPINALTNLFHNGINEDIQKVANNLPASLLAERNGSLLYLVLRAYSNVFEECPVFDTSIFGVPVLLKHIDFEKCLKKRFPDVSVKERLEVAAKLVPFLSPDEQERLFELLEDSLAQTKNKRDMVRFKNSRTPKAKIFQEHWNATNFRKTIKTEVEKVSVSTETKKRRM